MSIRVVSSSALFALLLAGTAAAQVPGAPVRGTVELGAFGQWTWFDSNAGRLNVVPEDGLGYGGRLGYFLTDRFQIEADGWYSPQMRSETDTFCCTGAQPTHVDASGIAARVNYNHPLGAMLGGATQFILGAGVTRTNYSFSGGTRAEEDNNSIGATALAGLRVGVLNNLAIRVDGVVDHMPNHEPSANTNVHARAGLSLLLGGARPLPVPVPAPAPAPAPRPAPAPAPAEQTINVCVVDGTRLAQVEAIFIPSRGDTVVVRDGQRRPFASIYPATAPAYAANAPWYVAGQSITVANREYVRFGLQRVIGATELTNVGVYNGVPLFAETGSTAPHAVLYLPIRPGCEFQPYQQRETIRVRG
jgi:opacity protein-like surface antigen